MRGSFGEICGMGRFGAASGSGSGGGIARSVERVMRKTGVNGLQDTLPSSSSSTPTKKSPSTKDNNALSRYSSSSSSRNTSNCNSGIGSAPVSAAWLPPPYFSATDFAHDFDQWEYVENYENDCVDHVFEAVPSSQEVEHALLSLQQGIRPISTHRFTNSEAPFDSNQDALDVSEKTASLSSDLDWIEPSMQIYNASRVHDAFHLLQTEPFIQRMMKSLASDKAVWEAVLNNEAVREIRESYSNAEPRSKISEENSDDADTNPNVLKWIFDNMKAKLVEVIGSITQLLGEISKPPNQDKTEISDTVSENVKSAFLLTIVVLLIVVVARAHTA